jgi:hypothetical protein
VEIVKDVGCNQLTIATEIPVPELNMMEVASKDTQINIK